MHSYTKLVLPSTLVYYKTLSQIMGNRSSVSEGLNLVHSVAVSETEHRRRSRAW